MLESIRQRSEGPGLFALVVGPSGAGKDTLIAAARARLLGQQSVAFPRRYITRPADAGGEDHQPLTMSEFEALKASNLFALSWQAHGLHYGVPESIRLDLALGRTVVANVSRSVVEAARTGFIRVRVIHVTASPSVLEERLAQRQRESAGQIRARLKRASLCAPEGTDVHPIDNSGPLEESVSRFIALITPISPVSTRGSTLSPTVDLREAASVHRKEKFQ